MKKGTRFVGLDVPKDTIAVAIAETGGEVRSLPAVAREGKAPRAARAVTEKESSVVAFAIGTAVFQGLERSRHLELVSTSRRESGVIAMHYRRKEG